MVELLLYIILISLTIDSLILYLEIRNVSKDVNKILEYQTMHTVYLQQINRKIKKILKEQKNE